MVFGKVLLITGGSGGGGEFLADRVRREAIEEVRAADADCEITELRAADLTTGEFTGVAGPSLFSASSAVVLSAIEDIADEVRDEVIAFAAAPAPEVAVVLLHGGGNKGKAMLDKLRAMAAVAEVKVEAPKYERDHITWVRQEFCDLGRSVDEQAASLLVASVGQDLRALAGATDQLVAVTPEGPIGVEVVRRYFGGRSGIRGYEIADAVLDGKIHVAIEKARWALVAKEPPVLITSAMATGIRSLLKFADIPESAGVPPWKVKVLRQQMRHWDAGRLAAAMQEVAQADLDVKGAAADAEYAVERMVIRVASHRKR